jgi:hypothetical protein
VGNNEWREMFFDVGVYVLPSRASDHKPLLITCMNNNYERRPYSKGFKFEASWLLDDEYNNIVQETWSGAEGGLTAASVAQEKLAACQTRLKNWSRKKFG